MHHEARSFTSVELARASSDARMVLLEILAMRFPSAIGGKRADVARARRRWMLEQGLFDPARLVMMQWWRRWWSRGRYPGQLTALSLR